LTQLGQLRRPQRIGAWLIGIARRWQALAQC